MHLLKNHGCCCIIILFVITVYKNFINKNLSHKRNLHIFINDAFYYNKSKSFPANTVIVLFSGHKFIDDLSFSCYSSDTKSNSLTTKLQWFRALEAPPQCKWTVYVVICPVIPNIDKFYLTSDHLNFEKIHFQPADNTPRNLVVCMSRMFSFENWQLFIASIEIYKHFGTNLIVTYLISLHPTLYKIMKYYEKDKILKMKPGHRYFKPVELDYDPNVESEWNNQDASYNSCLYEFKESAEFILFADWDDILIPAYHNNFKNELQWLQHLYPKASSFIFPRYTVQIQTKNTPFNFDISQLLQNIILNGKSETGKHISMPSKIHGTWIHAPTWVNKSFSIIRLDKTQTKMLHFRNWVYSEIEKSKNYAEKFLFLHATGINISFNLFLQKYNINELFLELPKKLVYYPLLLKCYDTIKKQLNAYSYHKCPSTPKCEINESIKVPCLNLVSTFKSVMLYKRFYLHQRTSFMYKKDNNGCLM